MSSARILDFSIVSKYTCYFTVSISHLNGQYIIESVVNVDLVYPDY